MSKTVVEVTYKFRYVIDHKTLVDRNYAMDGLEQDQFTTGGGGPGFTIDKIDWPGKPGTCKIVRSIP